MTPTPAQLKEPILRAIAQRSGFRAGISCSSKEVTEDVLRDLGYVPDDLQKARNNINFAATQGLRKEGLLAEATQRGSWALTEEGLARCTDPTEKPEPPTAESTPASPWVEDTGGMSFFSKLPVDTYVDDPYIRALAIASTRCFGGYSEQEETCATCPLARSCLAQQCTLISAMPRVVVPVGQPNEEPRAAEKQTPDATELSKITEEFEATLSESVDNSVDVTVIIESVCYRCYEKLKEGLIARYDPKRGYRHRDACSPQL